jgi:hypothetical protein
MVSLALYLIIVDQPRSTWSSGRVILYCNRAYVIVSCLVVK